MKVTVLGKYGPFAAAGGATSSYLVQGESTRIVLDFGSGALSRLLEFCRVSDTEAVVLSHLHYDHMCDLLPLGYYLKAHGHTLKLIFPDTDCFQRTILDDLEGFELIAHGGKEMAVGEFTLSFSEMIHPLQSYAVRVSDGSRTLFYSGDTEFCPQLMRAAEGSDLMILDCGKPDGSPAPHLSVNEAAYMANTLGIPAIASHLNPELRYVSQDSSVIIAEERKTYEV